MKPKHHFFYVLPGGVAEAIRMIDQEGGVTFTAFPYNPEIDAQLAENECVIATHIIMGTEIKEIVKELKTITGHEMTEDSKLKATLKSFQYYSDTVPFIAVQFKASPETVGEYTPLNDNR